MDEFEVRMKARVEAFLDRETLVDLASVKRKARSIQVRRRAIIAGAASTFAALTLIGAATLPGLLERRGRPAPPAGTPRSAILDNVAPNIRIPAALGRVILESEGRAVVRHSSGADVTLFNPDSMFLKGTDAAPATARPLPANLHGAIVGHVSLEVGDPVGTASPLGPFPASYVDFEVIDVDPEADCASRCIPLFEVAGETVHVRAGSTVRLLIANAEGVRLLAIIEPGDAPETTLREVTRTLRDVEAI